MRTDPQTHVDQMGLQPAWIQAKGSQRELAANGFAGVCPKCWVHEVGGDCSADPPNASGCLGRGLYFFLKWFPGLNQYRISPLKLQWTWVSYGKLEFAYLLIPLGINSVSGWLPSPPPRFLGDLAEAQRLLGPGDQHRVKVQGNLHRSANELLAWMPERLAPWRLASTAAILFPFGFHVQHMRYYAIYPASERAGVSCRYQAVCAFAKFSCVPGVGVQHRSLRTYCKLFLEWAL